MTVKVEAVQLVMDGVNMRQALFDICLLWQLKKIERDEGCCSVEYITVFHLSTSCQLNLSSTRISLLLSLEESSAHMYAVGRHGPPVQSLWHAKIMQQ